jgi:hypothetical protein
MPTRLPTHLASPPGATASSTTRLFVGAKEVNTIDGYEIGDLCSGGGQLTAGSKKYSVTQYFLNTTGACSTANYTSP